MFVVELFVRGVIVIPEKRQRHRKRACNMFGTCQNVQLYFSMSLPAVELIEDKLASPVMKRLSNSDAHPPAISYVLP